MNMYKTNIYKRIWCMTTFFFSIFSVFWLSNGGWWDDSTIESSNSAQTKG